MLDFFALCFIIRNIWGYTMQQVTNQQRLKPWMGFVLFAVLMALFIFVCAPMQSAWGIWGLVRAGVGGAGLH